MKKIKKAILKIIFFFREALSSYRKMPDFIIIGTQKGGTSSLFHYLKQHSGVSMSHRKEVHYYDLNYDKGESWYRTHFPFKSDKRLTGEASPLYIFHPHVPKRLHKDLPNVKLILLLREPADRAFSHYKMMRKKGREELNFREAIEQEDSRLQPEWDAMLKDETYNGHHFRVHSYAARGRYDEQIQNWYKYYPSNQILVIQSEDFFDNTEDVMKEVYTFLGLSYNDSISYINKNKGATGNMGDEMKKKLYDYFGKQPDEIFKLTGKRMKWY